MYKSIDKLFTKLNLANVKPSQTGRSFLFTGLNKEGVMAVLQVDEFSQLTSLRTGQDQYEISVPMTPETFQYIFKTYSHNGNGVA
jgi:hypothetical protein